MLYVKYPLSRRNVEYLLARRVIDVSHDTVRHWCNRFRMELLVPTDRVSSPMVCFCLP
jgi:transposase-like protein